MKDPVKVEIENFREQMEIYGTRTLHNLLSALLIWLFGILVFVPLASSLSWQAGAFCTLIFFVAFSILTLRALPNLNKLIKAFSAFPARKISSKKGIGYDNSLTLSQNFLYIILATILYMLYFPFLVNFHPAVSGIVLILVLIWIFFLASRILLILLPKMIEWLST